MHTHANTHLCVHVHVHTHTHTHTQYTHISRARWLTEEFYQIFNEELMSISLKSFYKIEAIFHKFPNSSHEVTIFLIPDPQTTTTMKELQMNFPDKYRCKKSR